MRMISVPAENCERHHPFADLNAELDTVPSLGEMMLF